MNRLDLPSDTPSGSPFRGRVFRGAGAYVHSTCHANGVASGVKGCGREVIKHLTLQYVILACKK